MAKTTATMDELARQVRTALDGGDLSSFRSLLDPDVTWGAPGARQPSCRNRDQVLAWYERGREAGTRAEVSDVSVLGDRLLVTMTVHGTAGAEDRGGAALRWQVLTVRDGRIVDIAGFDDRVDATAFAQASTG